MASIHLKIVTPEGTALDEDVHMVFLPCIEGELGVLHGHIPLLTQLVPGELRIVRGLAEEVLAVGEGFVEVTGSGVSVLTEMAEKEAEIDIDATEAAIARAKKALEGSHDHEEVATIEASLQRSLVKLNMKRRRGGR